MHEHVMCKNKDIMGDTQSNTSSTHINNQAHTSNYAWNIVIKQMECNAWAYDVRFTKPNTQYSQNSQKPKKFQNPKNLNLNAWNAWKREGLEHLSSGSSLD